MTLAAFEQTQPAVSRFFSHALKTGTLSHAYILKGSNPEEIYRFALAVGQILNCKTPASPGMACGQCKDCRWVVQNAHPALMTISRITYLEEDPKTTAFTQIRVEQVNQLLQQLGYSSEYTRVVIFTDVEELPPTAISSVVPPYEWQEANDAEKKSFHIRPLSRRHFNESSANRFLKTLEEPPKNTLFFFITDDEQNLLETIVSRCQLVRFAAGSQSGGEQALMLEQAAFFESQLWPAVSNRDCFRTAELFKAWLTEDQGLTPEQALGLFQRFLHGRFRVSGTAGEAGATRQYLQTQELLEETRRMIRDKTNADQALNRLFYSLSR